MPPSKEEQVRGDTALKPDTIRRVDAWLGVPVCWLLTICRRLGGLLRRRRDLPAAPRRILFIKLVELGANVQACAAMRRAVELVGRENVYFWVFDENRPILEILDIVPRENLLSIRATGPLRLGLDLLRSLWTVRRRKIDAVIDMEFFARASAILAFLTGARIRVGLHRFNSAGPYRGNLMTHRIQHNPYTHVSVYFQMLVEAAAGSANTLPLPKRPLPAERMNPDRFRPTEAELRRVRGLLRRPGGSATGGPIVLLNPNASDIVPLRKWPTERFIEVGRRLLTAHPEVTVAITGSPSERRAAEQIVAAIDSPRALSLAGETTLGDLLTLYCLADVLVTNDSGPAQFASLTDIDTVVLFGPETPLLWGPLGSRTHVLWAKLACSPCINPFNFRFSPCKEPRCMLDIAPDQVVEAVNQVLLTRSAGRPGQLPLAAAFLPEGIFATQATTTTAAPAAL
jgi:ADP-heptose:LPS heptosyltransferase